MRATLRICAFLYLFIGMPLTIFVWAVTGSFPIFSFAGYNAEFPLVFALFVMDCLIFVLPVLAVVLTFVVIIQRSR